MALPVGSSVAIPLPSNASTGYVWQLAEPLPCDCPVSVSIVPETAAPSRSGALLCGAPGVTLVRIAGLRKGSATLRLHYVRPWEQNRPAARARTLAVTVE